MKFFESDTKYFLLKEYSETAKIKYLKKRKRKKKKGM
jgi:hypothetical protein